MQLQHDCKNFMGRITFVGIINYYFQELKRMFRTTEVRANEEFSQNTAV